MKSLPRTRIDAKNFRKSTRSSTIHAIAAEDPHGTAAMADAIRTSSPEVLAQAASILRHPRSLSRPVATWRPPVIDLPAIALAGARPVQPARSADSALPALPALPALRMAMSRLRVGSHARERIRFLNAASSDGAHTGPAALTSNYSELAMPTYLLSCRFSTVDGAPLEAAQVEAWLQALLGAADNEFVYLIPDGSGFTAVWVVDRLFHALPTPPELFQPPRAA